jgi:hypothetical protein
VRVAPEAQEARFLIGSGETGLGIVRVTRETGRELRWDRAQIVAAWLENRDRAGTYRGAYHRLLVHDDQAIAVGLSSYYIDDTQTTLDRMYHNLWVVRFGEEGRRRSFTEWYMQAPSAS